MSDATGLLSFLTCENFYLMANAMKLIFCCINSRKEGCDLMARFLLLLVSMSPLLGGCQLAAIPAGAMIDSVEEGGRRAPPPPKSEEFGEMPKKIGHNELYADILSRTWAGFGNNATEGPLYGNRILEMRITRSLHKAAIWDSMRLGWQYGWHAQVQLTAESGEIMNVDIIYPRIGEPVYSWRWRGHVFVSEKKVWDIDE